MFQHFSFSSVTLCMFAFNKSKTLQRSIYTKCKLYLYLPAVPPHSQLAHSDAFKVAYALCPIEQLMHMQYEFKWEVSSYLPIL